LANRLIDGPGLGIKLRPKAGAWDNLELEVCEKREGNSDFLDNF